MKCKICGKYVDEEIGGYSEVKIIGEPADGEEICEYPMGDSEYIVCSEQCLAIDRVLFEAEVTGSGMRKGVEFKVVFEEEEDED